MIFGKLWNKKGVVLNSLAHLNIAFQLDFSSWSVWRQSEVHIFENGRILVCNGETGSSLEKDFPFTENWISETKCENLPKHVSKETLKSLRDYGNCIMRLEEPTSEFYNGPLLAMDVTIDTLKITVDGFTRIFKTHHWAPAWNGEKAFEDFLDLQAKAIEEAGGSVE